MRHPHTVAQLYWVPHGILGVFNTILYENEFQNPQIFQQTISLFPEHSTLVLNDLPINEIHQLIANPNSRLLITDEFMLAM
jgi:hypothetical protein